MRRYNCQLLAVIGRAEAAGDGLVTSGQGAARRLLRRVLRSLLCGVLLARWRGVNMGRRAAAGNPSPAWTTIRRSVDARLLPPDSDRQASGR